MANLEETREQIKTEIAHLAERLAPAHVTAVVSAGNTAELDKLLNDVHTLATHIAGLKALAAFPAETAHTEVPRTQQQVQEEAHPAKLDIPPAPQVVSKHYPDIRTLIGISEKIMFTRQLFDNNNALYEDAISQVSRSVSFEEAAAIMATLAEKHRWQAGNEAVQIFKDIVKRRFRE